MIQLNKYQRTPIYTQLAKLISHFWLGKILSDSTQIFPQDQQSIKLPSEICKIKENTNSSILFYRQSIEISMGWNKYSKINVNSAFLFVPRKFSRKPNDEMREMRRTLYLRESSLREIRFRVQQIKLWISKPL